MSTKDGATTDDAGVELDSRLSTVYEGPISITDLEQLII